MNKATRILVIDDEEEMLQGCKKILQALGMVPVPIANSKVGLQLLKDEEFDIVFCDLLMPEIDGMQILEAVQKITPSTPVIIFSAYGTIDRAVAAMKAGAFDFIEKPFDAQQIDLVIKKALRHRNLYSERNNLIKQLEEKFGFDNIIGKSYPMRKIFEMISSVSTSDANVLITGESGTGKELIARSIHAHSSRKTKPFVPVNCGAFPENLFEAEIFGYEKGAFTGASRRKIGLLEYASGGTFFMDEVCELPLTLQTKLLRTLQDKQFRRVGGNELIHTDIRLISATNRSMEKVLSTGSMREDLYYRINVINIHLPPLHERKGDIRLLAEHFLRKFVKASPKVITGFDEEVLKIFENYDWPGNIRELENIIERAVTLSKSKTITREELPAHMLHTEESAFSFDQLTLPEAKKQIIDDLEKKYLLFLLRKYKGHVTLIAKESGMTRRNIHRLLKQHGFDPNAWRK